MLLVVDIGNTHTHLGICQDGKIQKNWDIPTLPNGGPLFLVQSIQKNVPRRAGLIQGAAVASVVPKMDSLWWTVLEKKFRLSPVWVTSKLPLGIQIHYKPPGGVGADRIANAVGGFKKYGGPLIILDFGTAVTFDVVGENGDYLGGVIAPGIGLTIEALHRGTALLPKIELKEPVTVLGRDTVSAMRSGIAVGFGGMIKEIVARLKSELGFGDSVRIVTTGGYSEPVTKQLGFAAHADPLLTLEGLCEIYSRTRHCEERSDEAIS